jgi:hypothetical protein
VIRYKLVNWKTVDGGDRGKVKRKNRYQCAKAQAS